MSAFARRSKVSAARSHERSRHATSRSALSCAIFQALESRRMFANSVWAFPGADGHLLYQPQPLGDKIGDYSTSGYRGGTVLLPDVPVKATVSPVAGDDTATIQAAINQVGALALDANGFRGAVLLTPGTYEVGTMLTINKSGVVLRGSGAGNTLIHATGVGERTIIRIDGNVITLDAPITQALDLKYTDATQGGNTIYKYTASGRVSNSGVEYLGGYSDYNSAIVTSGDFTDEDHPWTFINVDGALNSW